MKPLVLHVLPTLESGGAERFVHDVAKRLPEKGFDVQVISILRGGPLVPLFQHSVPFRVLGVRGPFGIFAIRELYKIMKKEKPAIVHTHLFGADVWGRIAAWLAGVPVIISTEHNVNHADGVIKRLIKFLLSSITTAFIAPTQGVKTYMVKHESIPAKKIRVIANGIDLARIHARAAHGFHDIPRLITVGRLVPQKGHAILFKALALVKEPWMLEMIGTGPLEAELRALADRLGIASRIQWKGFCDAVPQRLAESDFFVFPSQHEGFGLALLEAVATGLPCIASDLPEFHEFLAKSDAHFIPVGDVPAWAEDIRSMLRHPLPAIEQAHASAERVRLKGSIDSTVAAYVRLYRECVHV